MPDIQSPAYDQPAADPQPTTAPAQPHNADAGLPAVSDAEVEKFLGKPPATKQKSPEVSDKEVADFLGPRPTMDDPSGATWLGNAASAVGLGLGSLATGAGIGGALEAAPIAIGGALLDGTAAGGALLGAGAAGVALAGTALVDRAAAGRILNHTAQAFIDAADLKNATQFSAKEMKGWRDAGFFNDYAKGERNLLKSIAESVVPGVVEGIRTTTGLLQGVFSGIAAAAGQSATEAGLNGNALERDLNIRFTDMASHGRHPEQKPVSPEKLLEDSRNLGITESEAAYNGTGPNRPIPPEANVVVPPRSPSGTTQDHIDAIIADATRRQVDQGRPEDEARAAAEVTAAHYETWADLWGGRRGNAWQVYQSDLEGDQSDLEGEQPPAPPSPGGGPSSTEPATGIVSGGESAPPGETPPHPSSPAGSEPSDPREQAAAIGIDHNVVPAAELPAVVDGEVHTDAVAESAVQAVMDDHHPDDRADIEIIKAATGEPAHHGEDNLPVFANENGIIKSRTDTDARAFIAEHGNDAYVALVSFQLRGDAVTLHDVLAEADRMNLEAEQKKQGDRDSFISTVGPIETGVFEDRLGGQYFVKDGIIYHKKTYEWGPFFVKDGIMYQEQIEHFVPWGDIRNGSSDDNGVAFASYVRDGHVKWMGGEPEHAENPEPEGDAGRVEPHGGSPSARPEDAAIDRGRAEGSGSDENGIVSFQLKLMGGEPEHAESPEPEGDAGRVEPHGGSPSARPEDAAIDRGRAEGSGSEPGNAEPVSAATPVAAEPGLEPTAGADAGAGAEQSRERGAAAATDVSGSERTGAGPSDEAVAPASAGEPVAVGGAGPAELVARTLADAGFRPIGPVGYEWAKSFDRPDSVERFNIRYAGKPRMFSVRRHVTFKNGITGTPSVEVDRFETVEEALAAVDREQATQMAFAEARESAPNLTRAEFKGGSEAEPTQNRNDLMSKQPKDMTDAELLTMISVLRPDKRARFQRELDSRPGPTGAPRIPDFSANNKKSAPWYSNMAKAALDAAEKGDRAAVDAAAAKYLAKDSYRATASGKAFGEFLERVRAYADEKAGKPVAVNSVPVTALTDKELAAAASKGPSDQKVAAETEKDRRQAERAAVSQGSLREIGKNPAGDTLYENQDGVRSLVDNGIREHENVQIVPSPSGTKPSVDPSRRQSRFKTAEEIAEEERRAGDARAEAAGDIVDQQIEWEDRIMPAAQRAYREDFPNGSNKAFQDYMAAFWDGAGASARTREQISGVDWKGNPIDPDILDKGYASGARWETDHPRPGGRVAKNEGGGDGRGPAASAGGAPADGGGGREALEGVPAEEIRGAEGVGEAPGGTDGGGGTGVSGTGQPHDRSGDGLVGGAGRGDAAPHPSSGRVQSGRGADGQVHPVGGDASAQSGTEGAGPGIDIPGAGRRAEEAAAGKGRPAGSAPGQIADRPTDYVITDADRLGEGSLIQKYKDNVAAIRLIRELEAGDRRATPEEQAILARYVGWGALKAVFPRRENGQDVWSQGWEKRGAEVRALLSDEEYNTARRSSLDAHYTSEPVIKAIYRILDQLGFKSGRILEPSMGVGNFFGLMPSEMKSRSALTGVEMDYITGTIAKHLYPDANVQAPVPFQESKLADNHFDAAVGNPPFGSQRVPGAFEPEIKTFSIHNYFFARTIMKLRPGGVMGMVVTHRFLDAQRDLARSWIAHRVEFLGAIRLPNNAFKENAGTEVTTDLVFFRKLPDEQWGTSDQSWTKTGLVPDPLGGEPIPLNKWFIDRPEMMLGTFDRSGKQPAANSPALHIPLDVEGRPVADFDIEREIARAAGFLPRDVYQEGSCAAPTEEMARKSAGESEAAAQYKPQAFFHDGGRLMKRIDTLDGSVQAQEITPETQWTEKRQLGAERHGRLNMVPPIRDAARKLLRLEASDAPDAEIEAARADLNKVYDEFVAKNGLLSENKNRSVFNNDPDSPLLLALENQFDKGVSKAQAKKLGIEEKSPTATKADIFRKRVILRYEPVTKAETAKDALAVSLADRGAVDLEHMAKLTGRTPDDLIRELHDEADRPEIFKNPETGAWEIADQYLSGNVKRKALLAEREGLGRNVDALKAVFPEPRKAGDIAVKINSSWVNPKYIEDFVRHLLGDETKVSIIPTPSDGKFSVYIKTDNGVANANRWGTPSRPANELLDSILNNKMVEVSYTDANGKKIVDADKTQAANDKAGEIKEEFQNWIFHDADRRKALVDYYNDNLNYNVKPKFDGSHVTLIGKSPSITMRPHQNNAIWRTILQGKALYDHVVGSGKTFTAIASAMELKRMGLVRKSMIVVPNHLVNQWAEAFYRLYPGANILTVTKADFTKANRQRVLGRIAAGDWDAVIYAHSSFGFIPRSPRLEMEFLEQQIAEAQESVDNLKAAEGKTRRVGDMERAKENMKAKLMELMRMPKDNLLTFEELGVDMMFVDEAQEFKNLMFTTSRSVQGLGNPKGSKKALDMWVKSRWLQDTQNGRGVVMMTGTPVSNSLTELYTMQRYLGLNELSDLNIKSFDAWMNNFGEINSKLSIDSTGVGMKMVERFRDLNNAPEVMRMYQQYADSVTNDMLKRDYREQTGEEFPIPRVRGGKRDQAVVPRNEHQARYMADIVDRMMHLSPEDNMLNITTDARKCALDMRLIDPNLPGMPGSKAERAVDNIVNIWRDTKEDKGTQLVFLDLSIPVSQVKGEITRIKQLIADARSPDDDVREKAEEELDKVGEDAIAAANSANVKFSVYDEMRQMMIDRGIPADEIAFIHDYNTDDRKQDLFDAVNAGKVRVLMGSTQKMGAGTNVQQRLVALHHMDCPWRPSDIEQREGRIIRQGNKLLAKYGLDKFEAQIFAYATKETYDSRMWQTQEEKSRSIDGLRQWDGELTIPDFSASAASAAEMKAAITGNPLIMEQVDLSMKIEALDRAQRNWRKNFMEMDDQCRVHERAIERNPKEIEALSADAATIRDHELDPFQGSPPTGTINGVKYSSAADARKAIHELFDKIKAGAPEGSQPRYRANINGVDMANRELIEAEIRKHWGNVDPFKINVNGRTIINRSDLAHEITISFQSGKAVKGTFLGIPFDIVGEQSNPKCYTITLGVGGKWQRDNSALYGDRSKGYTLEGAGSAAVRFLEESISTKAYRSQADMKRWEVETARKSIPSIKEELGKPFTKGGELQEAKAQKSVVDRLLSEGSKEMAAEAAAAPNGETVPRSDIPNLNRDLPPPQSDKSETFEQKRQGRVTFPKTGIGTGPTIIKLLSAANASTFMHEMAHVWFERMIADSRRDDCPESIKRDLKVVRDWLGAEHNAPITKAQHERFAKGFEQYLRTGQAPSSRLARAFSRFREWLTDIYQTIKGLGHPISPEIKGVYDRLLAGTEDTVERRVTDPEPATAWPAPPPSGWPRTPLASPVVGTPGVTKVGDIVKTEDGLTGRVVAMDVLNARIETPDGQSAVRPVAGLRTDYEATESAAAAPAQKPAGAASPPTGEATESAAAAPAQKPAGAASPPTGEAAAPAPGVSATNSEASRAIPERKTARPTGQAVQEPPMPTADAPSVETAAPAPPRKPGQKVAAKDTSPFDNLDDVEQDKAANIRLDNWDIPEDIKEIMRETARENGDHIDMRRGVLLDWMVLRLAETLGVDPSWIFSRKVGQAFNAEQIKATQALFVQTAAMTRDAGRKAAASGTEADILAYARVRAKLLAIQEQYAGITAEGGRALRAFAKSDELIAAAGIGSFLKDSTGKTLFQLAEEAKFVGMLNKTHQIGKFLNDSRKPNFSDMILEYYINALISGPATHLTYTIGNAVFALWRAIPETAMAATVGAVREALTGNAGGADRVYFSEVRGQLFGLMKGTPEGIKAFVKSFHNNKTTALPGEVEGDVPGFTDFHGRGDAIPGVVGKVIRLPSRAVTAIHSFFRTVGYCQAIHSLAYRMAAAEGLEGNALSSSAAFAKRVAEIVTNPSEEMMKQARSDATDQVLMRTPTYKSLQWHVEGLANYNLATKIAAPFVRIASNIVREGIVNRSILGLFSGEVRENLMAGGARQDIQLAKIAMGTTLMVTFIGLALQGYVSGAEPRDPKERDTRRQLGETPYSVRLGDVWVPYNRLGPMGTLMGMGAEFSELWNSWHDDDDADAGKVAAALIEGAARTVLDETWMRGVHDILDAMFEPERHPAYFQNLASSFLPYSVGLGQEARYFDAYERQARTFMDKLANKIPYVRQSILFPRRDVWGEPIRNPPGFGFGQTAFYMSPVNTDPVNTELSRLGIWPAQLTRKIRGIDLTDQEYDDYSRTAGRLTKAMLTEAVSQPGWRTGSNGDQRTFANKVIKENRERARKIIMMQYPHIAMDARAAKLDDRFDEE